MWSKKWYLKRNISCDAHLLNELLETEVPWDDAIVVSADKMRKLWDSLSELCSSLCERLLEMTVLRPALLPVKTAQFTQFFRQAWRHTVKLLSLTECIGRFRCYLCSYKKQFEVRIFRSTTFRSTKWTVKFLNLLWFTKWRHLLIWAVVSEKQTAPNLG
jgi:hypothetical protein